MNKRQVKKKKKITSERVHFFSNHIIISARGNGKTSFYLSIIKACQNRHYKPFKMLKKIYKKLYISLDVSNVRDYTTKTTFSNINGIIKIFKTGIIKR